MRMIAISVMGVLAGCASSEPPLVNPSPQPAPPLNVRVAPPLKDAVPIQTSRYVLERQAPAVQLTDMLNVPVDARMPAMSDLTIKDGLEFLLTGSGMQVRTATSYGESQLYAQSLPVSQMNMGQMPLRQALQVLGGQAFELEEDIVKREVGFRLKEGYVWTPPKYDSVQPSMALDNALNANRAEALSEFDNDLFFASGDEQASERVIAAAQKNPSQRLDKSSAYLQSNSPAKASKSSTLNQETFVMREGERYRDVLLRWTSEQGFEHVAFAQEPAFLTAIDSISTSGMVAKGSLRTAVAKLAQQVPALSTLTLYENEHQQLAALHPYQYGSVQAFIAQGATLEDAVKHAVKQYQWNWDEKHSWTVGNYAFISDYPVVTRRDDISGALSILLKQYPLEARRLDANRTIYIREASPL